MAAAHTSLFTRVFGAAALAGAAGFAGYLVGANGDAAAQGGDAVTPIFQQALPNVPGKSLTAVTVDYAPGGASAAHHHHESAVIFAYVVSGSVHSKVNDGEVTTYQAGEFFFEPPGSAHSVSENASDSEPARILAIVIADEGVKTTTYDE